MTGPTSAHYDLAEWLLISATPNEMRKLAGMIEQMPDASDEVLRLAEQIHDYADSSETRLKSQSIPRQKKKILTTDRMRRAWRRFRIWRAYRRPVTFYDLRKILHDAQYPTGEITAVIHPNADAAMRACIERVEARLHTR